MTADHDVPQQTSDSVFSKSEQVQNPFHLQRLLSPTLVLSLVPWLRYDEQGKIEEKGTWH